MSMHNRILYVDNLCELIFIWSKRAKEMSSINIKFNSIIFLCELGYISHRDTHGTHFQNQSVLPQPLMCTVFISGKHGPLDFDLHKHGIDGRRSDKCVYVVLQSCLGEFCSLHSDVIDRLAFRSVCLM